MSTTELNLSAESELPRMAAAAGSLVHNDEATPVPSAAVTPAEIIIRPATGWQLVNVRELWQYRELLFFLTWRDVKVRYKQTLLGAAWAILQPVMMMVVFTVF